LVRNASPDCSGGDRTLGRAAYRGLALLLFGIAVVVGAVGVIGIVVGVVSNTTAAFSDLGWGTLVAVVILIPLIAGVWYGLTVFLCMPFLALGRKMWEKSRRP